MIYRCIILIYFPWRSVYEITLTYIYMFRIKTASRGSAVGRVSDWRASNIYTWKNVSSIFNFMHKKAEIRQYAYFSKLTEITFPRLVSLRLSFFRMKPVPFRRQIWSPSAILEPQAESLILRRHRIIWSKNVNRFICNEHNDF